MKRILLLSSAEVAETRNINDNFVDIINERIGGDVHLEWQNYHSINAYFGFDDKLRVELDDGRQLTDFDFVYFKSFFRYSELASIIARYLDTNGVPFVCSELLNQGISTKLSQLSSLSLANIAVPKTMFRLRTRWENSFDDVVRTLGLPFIFKSTDGSTGDENYLIKSNQDLSDALANHSDDSLEFIAQEFIPNDSDFRVLIVGGVVGLIIERSRDDKEASHLNNTSKGASARLVSPEHFEESIMDMCLRSASILGRDIAGVDLMFSSVTGIPYILEVNASPQIGSGAFMEEKVNVYVSYFQSMVSG